MSENINMREVRFDEWCKKCKYYDTPEEEDPCFTCLDDPAQLYSSIPVKYDGPRPTTKKDWAKEANIPKG